MAASEEMVEPLETLASHVSTQLMKAESTLRASDETKRAKGKGGTDGYL